ncbi:hypothetical protein CEUSTIGMA_g10860.t1 [Chlamydomonas eustigma]|uniref:GCK domain-containing protein n=1 Tax=Chlamydomonas eustigma TaxID=1157962 RepID=A0A250XK24_9CHLO|nr:hypothetical protein CEUSTIGMA_g10860.t1 [Chlamydomonas eustigma]|eukprot:GAX83435.1 hypothetical protein CEUSTIGMA_g10860.t1 [Chlamydomonas eustigma]
MNNSDTSDDPTSTRVNVSGSDHYSSKSHALEVDPSTTAGDQQEGEKCPICLFIEAGDCGNQHKEWTACREEAKRKGDDYVEVCHEQFKTFMQCAMDNAEYYEPFLNMLFGERNDDDTSEKLQN